MIGIASLASAPTANVSERQKKSTCYPSSPTGLVQVLTGHPLADPRGQAGTKIDV